LQSMFIYLDRQAACLEKGGRLFCFRCSENDYLCRPTLSLMSGNLFNKQPTFKVDSNIIKRPKAKKRLVDDVNRLIEAMGKGEPIEKHKSEILRLRNLILDNQAQNIVIEGCGKDVLSLVLEWGQKLRKYKNKNKSPKDPEKEFLNVVRERWLRWFRGAYGINSKDPMSEDLYFAILSAANYVDFAEVLKTAKTDMHFHQNGLAECYSVAKNEGFYKSPPTKSRKRSAPKESGSHITRKEWGSAYKPARG